MDFDGGSDDEPTDFVFVHWLPLFDLTQSRHDAKVPGLEFFLSGLAALRLCVETFPAGGEKLDLIELHRLLTGHVFLI
jgi:hypothetical protein